MTAQVEDFHIGQRVMVSNPPVYLPEYEGCTGVVQSIRADSIIVKLDSTHQNVMTSCMFLPRELEILS